MQELKAEKPLESPAGSDPVLRLMERLGEEGFSTEQGPEWWNEYGEVIYRRRPLIVRDVESYRAFRRGLHVGSGIRSWLGVPLMNDDHIIGMLALDKTEAGFYQTHHSRAAMEHAARIAELLDRDESVPSAECG